MSGQFHKVMRSIHMKSSTNAQNTPNPSFQDSSQKFQVSFTKSPYASSMPKNISIKPKPKSVSCANSGLASPQYTNSPSNLKNPQNSVLKKHFSSILSRKKIFIKASQKKLPFKNMKIDSEIKEEAVINNKEKKIKRKLNEIIVNMKEKQLNYENFEKIQEIFVEIIQQDSVFGQCLAEIKEFYDEWIKGKVGYVAKNTQLKVEMAELDKKLKEKDDEIVGLTEMISKLSQENAKIGKENEVKDKQYRSLQEHLIKISTVDKSTYPPSEEAWKMLLVENKTYSEICDCMKTDIKNLKTNENKLLDLIEILRSEGYPVDEIYRQLVHPKFSKKKKKSQKKIELGSEEDENLISSRQDIHKKPQNIPELKLNQVSSIFKNSSFDKESSSINSF